MRAHRLGLATVAAVMLSLGAVTPSSAAPAHRSSGDQCTSTSTTGSTPSRYNKTPKGSGPWHVPLDPCNTEGAGATKTPYYNCAYWAAEKRPDLWVNAVWKYGYSNAHPGAWRIPVDAKKAGYPVDRKPQVGDIGAWGRNVELGSTGDGLVYTAGPGGHVAYVEKVLSHHRITLSSMGQGSKGGYTTTIFYNKKRSQFIHQLS